MRERRALRFLVEAPFLGALAAALVVADLDPLWIAGVMLLGWIVVAFYEWAATRELPHYGRGLPPRYYVPQIALPPPRQLEQLRSAYPAAAPDDQATWIATPAMRAEALAGWPLNPAGGPLPPPTPGEDTMVVDDLLLIAAAEEYHQDTWIELDPIAEGKGREGDALPVAVVESVVEDKQDVVDEPVAVEPEAEPEAVLVEEALEEPEVVEAIVEEADEGVLDDLEPVALAAAVAAPEATETSDPEHGNGVDPVLAAAVAEAAVAEPEPEAVEVEAEPDEGVDAAIAAAAAAAVVEPEVIAEPEPEPEHVLAPVVAAAAVVEREEIVEPEPEPEPQPEPDHGLAAVTAAAAAAAVVADRERDAEVEPDADPVPAEAELEPVVVAAAVADRDALVELEPVDDTDESAVATPVVPVPDQPSRHTFDPLADISRTGRRWRRRDDPWIEVPARPPVPLALPGAARREP